MMGRATVILYNDGMRHKAMKWAENAPMGTRVEFKEAKRTLPQNDHMWALLTHVAAQKTHHGNKYTTDQWKCLFLHALGREMQFLPALEGAEFIPYGNSSSDLTVSEMSELIELIYSWGAKNNVDFGEDSQS